MTANVAALLIPGKKAATKTRHACGRDAPLRRVSKVLMDIPPGPAGPPAPDHSRRKRLRQCIVRT
ncbi:MAG: hypothetical protein AMXMBFR59_39750 [Rhodanobacteraceae bacterium]